MRCHRLKTTSMHTPRPLLFKEYILILSSAGIMSYFMIEILAILTGQTLTKTTILSRAFGMLETSLHTYLLINSSRRTPRDSHRVSPFIPYSSIILVTFYLTYWLLDSYNKHIITNSRCIGYSQWDVVEIILNPLVTFFRFFAGMSAYSMYKIYEPNGWCSDLL